MRRVTYQSVEDRWAVLMGMVPGEISTADLAKSRAAINHWLREFWEHFYWPDLTLVEKRFFRPLWNGTDTYAAAAERYHVASGAYYQSLRGSNTNHAPADADGEVDYEWWYPCQAEYDGDDWAEITYAPEDVVRNPADNEYYACHTAHTGSGAIDLTKFGILTPFVRSVDYEQAGETVIGDVRECWLEDPNVNPGARKVEKTLRADYFVIHGGQNYHWVEFRQRPHQFSGAAYSAEATYDAEDQMFYTDGDFYKCLDDTTAGQSPATHPEKWERMDFPWVLAEAVARGAYADTLVGDGQNEKRPLEEQAAWGIIFREIDRIERGQNQNRPLPVTRRR